MTKHPPLQPVKSSALAAMSYDPATKKLRVKTHAGKVYEYDDVSHERAHVMETCASMGSYWNTEIKPNHIGREVFDA